MHAHDVQNVLAPMVLENLNCSGTEPRLVDCPGDMDEFETAYSDYDVRDIRLGFTYFGVLSTYCDPLQGTYAFVACGTLPSPGALPLRLQSTGGLSARPSFQIVYFHDRCMPRREPKRKPPQNVMAMHGRRVFTPMHGFVCSPFIRVPVRCVIAVWNHVAVSDRCTRIDALVDDGSVLHCNRYS